MIREAFEFHVRGGEVQTKCHDTTVSVFAYDFAKSSINKKD